MEVCLNLENEIWLLLKDNLFNCYLYIKASQQPPGAFPISSEKESVLGLESTDRQTDRPATGLGSQFSLLGVGSVLRMGKKLAHDWLPVPIGVKTETQCKVLKNKTTEMSDCEQYKNKEDSLAQWNVFKHFKVKGCCRVFCHNHSCSNTYSMHYFLRPGSFFLNIKSDEIK